MRKAELKWGLGWIAIGFLFLYHRLSPIVDIWYLEVIFSTHTMGVSRRCALQDGGPPG